VKAGDKSYSLSLVKSSILCLLNTVTALGDNLRPSVTFFFPCFLSAFASYIHTPLSVGNRLHARFAWGRLRWNDSTARRTPCSRRIFTAIASAARFVFGSSRVSTMTVKFASVMDVWWTGRGLAPAAATMSPQYGWLETGVNRS
jgi:hypothetical protein